MTDRPCAHPLAAMLTIALLALPAAAWAQTAPISAPSASAATPVERMDITALQGMMAQGTLSSEALVRLYQSRMDQIDDAGPRINAVVATYADALAVARQRDAERAAGRLRGPLHGIPILIKDNIEAQGPLPTTAGSMALATNVTGRDAPLVARLRAGGAIILGRTNLSEWANFRSDDSTSGWSGLWGLTRNPHSLDRSACGSSSGSGAAIAAGLASAAIGTETDGSITCPAGINGIVGFKPTLGLISRRYIVPISASQDSAGPMVRSVRDAALMLTVMAGTDPEDPATAEADARRVDYAAALSGHALSGMRIGVMREWVGQDPAILRLLDRAITLLRQRGATVVEISESGIDRQAIGSAEFTVLLADFKADLNAYLAGLPSHTPAGTPRTLADVIAYNRAEPRELRWFGQDTFEAAEAAPPRDSEAYRTALATARRLAGVEGIDRMRREHGVDLLIAVTNGPSWSIDLINGDNFRGPSASQLPAVAGYPHLTVPMGAVEGMPIGLSFIGTRWDDARVLAAGDEFAQAGAHLAMVPTPGFRTAIDDFGRVIRGNVALCGGDGED